MRHMRLSPSKKKEKENKSSADPMSPVHGVAPLNITCSEAPCHLSISANALKRTTRRVVLDFFHSTVCNDVLRVNNHL